MPCIFSWLLFSKSSWMAQKKQVCNLIWKWCELKEQRFCKREITHTALSSVSHRHDCVRFSLPSCLLTYFILSGNLLSFHFLLKHNSNRKLVSAEASLIGKVAPSVYPSWGWCEEFKDCVADLLQYVAKFLFLITCPCVFTWNLFKIPFSIFGFCMGQIEPNHWQMCSESVVCEVSHMTLSGF